MSRRTWIVRTATAVFTVASLSLTACAAGSTDATLQHTSQGATMDDWTRDVVEHVQEAHPRVAAVEDVEGVPNGLGTALVFHLVLDSPVEPSADELRRILQAAWAASAFEPNAIRVTASSATTQEVVNLRPAASALTEHAGPFGNGGISFTDLRSLFGKHPAPGSGTHPR